MPPTTGQLGLLALAGVLFAAGAAASWSSRRRADKDAAKRELIARWCVSLGVLASAGVIAWHSVTRRQWQPMTDNFDALVWLAALLAIAVLYLQAVKPIHGLDRFLMPVVILLLAAAALFGTREYHAYRGVGQGAWVWVHRVSSYGGAAAFAVAGAGGAMYLVASRRLRRKRSGPMLGSLETLERMMMAAVTLGFVLLSVGLITGVIRIASARASAPTAKVLLASLAWLVYAVVLHAPITPGLRGRRAAVLSVFGFALVAGTLAAVLLLSGGHS